MSFRPLIPAEEASRRLELVFPRAAFDSVLSSPAAGAAVVAMIYVDAVLPAGDGEPAAWARPSTCTWMSDSVLAHAGVDERVAWRSAAERTKKAVVALLNEWGVTFEPRYADNTRENLRDETFRAWLEHGALRQRAGVPTSSGLGRWALSPTFAALFDPALTGDELVAAVEQWRDANMSPGSRLRAARAAARADQEHQVVVDLPGGERRSLEPGRASLILKGVIEEWAPRRLGDPVVLTISEPGDKIFTGDAGMLRRLRIRLDLSRVLPDAVIADLAETPALFWIVEAVATDGAITEERKAKLVAWAEEQNIRADECRFLSAFVSRADGAARRRLKDLASGTYAWFADEPHHELAWYELG
ncbi:MAG: BsuBI/PstI family type II restriction endonuclease [Acidimicrobiales bacterium]